MKSGKVVAEKNGYLIRECYHEDENGNLYVVGYAVFRPDGSMMKSFVSIEAAHDYLNATVPSAARTPGPKP